MEIQSLTVSERIILAEALWDSVISEDDKIEMTESQILELDKRLKTFEIDQDEGATWALAKSRILAKK